MKKIQFKSYSDLTTDDLRTIAKEWHNLVDGGLYEPKHAIACVAHDIFGITDRGWNGKVGANAFAAVCAALVWTGSIKVGR